MKDLYMGDKAGEVIGYANASSFKYARDRHPIPDEGYRVNGKPAWTREHLLAWRSSIPAPGRKAQK